METLELHFCAFIVASMIFMLIWIHTNTVWQIPEAFNKTHGFMFSVLAALSFSGLLASVGWVGYMKRELGLSSAHHAGLTVTLILMALVAAKITWDATNRQRHQSAPTT